MKMHRYADGIRRTVIIGSYLGGIYFGLPFMGHKDFPESRWSNLCLLAPDVVCWLVAWLTWLAGVRAARRREAAGSPTKWRHRFIEALSLMILGTVFTLIPGFEELAHSDY